MLRKVARRIVLCLLMALPLGFAGHETAAQDYPRPVDDYINDFAAILTPEAADSLRADLVKLKAQTGVPLVILTVPDRPADGTAIKAYATGLFNAWGIADPARNNGILIFVNAAGHELWMTLGKGYGQDYDTLAQDIVNRVFLPRFRSGDYSGGIEEGTRQTMDRIARRYAQGLQAEPLPQEKTSLATYVPAALAVGMVGLVLYGRRRRRARDADPRPFTRCPKCGATDLQTETSPLPDAAATNAAGAATGAATGAAMQHVVTRCPRCSWRDERDMHAHSGALFGPDRQGRGKGSDGGSFGGGKSSGGGAGGRW